MKHVTFQCKLPPGITTLLSHTWWILISQNKQQYFTNNYYQYNTFLNFYLNPSLLLEKVKQNMRPLVLEGFPGYIYNGIPFAAHFARVKKTPQVYG